MAKPTPKPTPKLTTVKCPTCQKAVAWTSENRFKPFCSERCKLIDLGEWAAEEKRIPGDPTYPDQESSEPRY